MTKTRRQKLESLITSIANIAEQCESEVLQANRERDAANAEVAAKPIDGNLEGDPITAERLAAVLDYDLKTLYYKARYGRLWFGVKLDGQWSAETDSTYGGRAHSYRKLKNMKEVETLIELFGVKTREQWQQGG